MSETIAVADLVGECRDPFVVADRGPIRIIVLNRPEARNALTRQMRRDFPAYIAAADADAAIAAIVLTGMDPTFSGGVDLKERNSGPPQAPIVPNPGEVLRAARKPVIAAVNGACVTGALEMALSCSFIVASEQARFADTHAKLGIFPRWGQTALLPRAIGGRRALQMMLSAAFIDAKTAYEWGLANEVTPHAELLSRCIEIGTAIGAADPRSLGLHLDALREIEAGGLNPALEVERRTLMRFDGKP